MIQRSETWSEAIGPLGMVGLCVVRPRTHTASLVGTSMPTESMAVIGQGSPGETNILIG